MKFIPTLEITSKIMSLIEEAQKELIVVSPYVNIQKWGKMKSCLERAIERGVAITIIARKNAEQDLSYFNNSKINLVLVMDLHAKLYMNDKYAIVTSQNLLQSSDNNSIEIGYITTNNLERKELVAFVNQFIFKIQPIIEETKSINIKEVQEIENRMMFKEWQVEKALEIFNEAYKKTTFKPTLSYIFSSNLLPFADVMIHGRLVIKYEKRLTNSNELATRLKRLNIQLKNDFEVEYLVSHNTHYYFEFVPQGKFYFYSVVEDYVTIIKEILKSKIGVEFKNTRY